jgi:hypothetical protein
VKLSSAQWTSLGLAVLALCSVTLVLVTGSRPTTTELSERSRNLILVWRDDEVRSLKFSAKGVDFRIERLEAADAGPSKEDDFVLHAPEREPADGAAVDRLISSLGFATPVRRLEDAAPNALGLATPEVTIEVRTKKTTLRLSLGKSAPSPEGAAYVSVKHDESEAVFAVVSKEVAALFRMRPDDFRERAFIGFGKSEIREVVLEQPGATLRLVRAGEAFRIDGKMRANRDTIEPIFAALSRFDAKRFLAVRDAEKARGMPPSLVVRVTPSDAKAKPAVIELGGSCPGAADEVIAVARSPRVRAGCIERAVAFALEVERSQLFDKEPFSARADEVEALRMDRNGRRLVLERRGSAFLLREPSEATIALEAGNERLAAILRAPADLVPNPDPRKLGLDPPEGRVVATTVQKGDKAAEETVAVGRTEPDGTLYLQRSDDGAVLALGRDAARAFAVDSTLLKSLRVVDFALSSLAELELGAPERQVLRRASSGFELIEPRGFQHDGTLATDAVLALGSLTALRFVADRDDGTFGFEKPTLTATARHDADGGARTTKLVVGRATPGGFFAKIEGDPSVFVIERVVAERLSTLLIDRSPFLVDPKTLARVTLVSNGVTRTFERKHDELVAADASGIDPAVAARVVEALSTLRAEAAAHTGPAGPYEGFANPVLEVRYEPLPGLGKPRSFTVGTTGMHSFPWAATGQAARFARAKGIEATFLIADAKLKPLFDLF